MKDYIHNLDNDGLASETILYNIMDSHFIKEFINTEVEILEDNTEEIEELKYDVVDENDRGWYKLDTIADKVNELVRKINRLNTKND